MKAIQRLPAIVALAGSCLCAPAWSASYSTDQSDLWWIPDESGWGIQLVQRNSTIFATMFVYDASGAPTWYVSTMNANGLTWQGDLYATRGPWFATVPFDPSTVNVTKVGTMTWAPATVEAGTLTYTVNEAQVTKALQREFMAVDDFGGDYGGNLHQVDADCSDAAQNGTTDLVSAVAVRQDGSQVVLATADENGQVCTYSGTLAQAGQMANVHGTFNCNDGSAGTFSIYELQVTVSGITMRFTLHPISSGCATTGWFGGGRATTF
jgi:hypothetical protein